MVFLMRAAEVFRDFVTGGVPSSGKWKPKKSDVRAWGEWIESVIAAFFSAGGKIYQTRGLLNGDLTPAANSIAWVMEDPIVANNGIYRKVGGAGTGSWVRAGDLPFSFIVASNIGAGTPNAIQATTSVPVSSSALVMLPLAAANTATPVTVSFNGGPALTIKTVSGGDVIPGGLTAGMVALGVVSGSTFRLTTDQASAAILELAQAAVEAALAAANAGFVFDDIASFADATIPGPLSFIRTAGYHAAGDGGEALYKRVATEPSHLAKVQTADGAWWELAETEINLKMTGAKGDGIANDTAAWLRANSLRRPLVWTYGTYLIDFMDWTDRSYVVPMRGDAAIIKKRVNNGSPLFKINNDTLGAAGYVPPNVISGLIFDGDNKTNYGVLAYNIARWKFEDCTFRNCTEDGFLQLGGAHTLLERVDGITNGRSGIAFDKYAYGYPNANVVRHAGLFDNLKAGIYFDGGRALEVHECDIEGNGTAGQVFSAGIWVGNLIGTEPGTTEKPGLILTGGWLEGNKGTGGAVRFGSGFNRIGEAYFCANASIYDVLVEGGRYAIDRALFDGVRTHVHEAAGAGFGNSIVECSTGGTHEVDPKKTSVFGADDPWVEFTPTLTPDTGTITQPNYALGFYQRVGKNMHIVVLAGITTAGTGAGDLRIGGLPAPIKRNTHISGHYNLGTTGGPAQANQTYFRQRKYDGSTIIMNGMDLVVTGFYEVAN